MGHGCAYTWPYMGHACAHTWPYMGAYMGHMGAVLGHACAHTWAMYGGSNGACMRAYMGHIWGQQWGMHARIYGHIWQPYRESREEGNSRESLPFPGPGKGITPGREGNPYPIPQRRRNIIYI